MEFKEKTAEFRRIIDDRIDKLMESKKADAGDDFLAGVYEVMRRYIGNGGKRVRPIATMAVYESLAGKDDRIVEPAMAVEFLHNSTLCHDDIMDEDASRRGSPSCHKACQEMFLKRFDEREYGGDVFSKASVRFGSSFAILDCNVFNFLAFDLLSRSSFDDRIKTVAIARVSDVLREVNHGQFLDIFFEHRWDISEEEYMWMIKKKTGVLLACSFELGAVFAGAGKEVREAFFEYGLSLGIAFQMIDDLMDLDEESNKGRAVGSDIRKGKKTLIIIKAFESVGGSDRSFLMRVLGDANLSDADVRKSIRILKDAGSIDYVRDLAKSHVARSHEIVRSLQGAIDPQSLVFFDDLADFIVNRRS